MTELSQLTRNTVDKESRRCFEAWRSNTKTHQPTTQCEIPSSLRVPLIYDTTALQKCLQNVDCDISLTFMCTAQEAYKMNVQQFSSCLCVHVLRLCNCWWNVNIILLLDFYSKKNWTERVLCHSTVNPNLYETKHSVSARNTWISMGTALRISQLVQRIKLIAVFRTKFSAGD